MSESILIVGGGPVGATFALALQHWTPQASGLSVTLLEARPQGAAHADQRALALSYGSRLILERLGLWAELKRKVTPIHTIHISQRGSLGRSRLKAQDYEQDALGYVVAYGDLSAALDHALSKLPQVNILYGANAESISPGTREASVVFKHEDVAHEYKSTLVVLADGGKRLGEIEGLKRNTKEYGHDALVTKVSAEYPHDNIAYERFIPSGPVALLPNGARDFSLVWTGKTDDIKALLTLDDATFLNQLHDHFGDRVGHFLKVEKRLCFPLKLSYLEQVTAPHLAVIGNAAQTMHPVAGQGFNVGMRDAWQLAQAISASSMDELGNEAMLSAYQRGRKTDTKRGMLITDFMVNLFSNDLIGISPARGLAIGLLDFVKPAKQHFVSKMSFGSQG
ncbi:FAD-dependent monooxygenase [Methyloradius palustris]|uniref:2-octaprenyl-6-methoxyphenol hydroxylase n=1 Tax=Methyloradius palustris TaxID=2778876 RepID=A0A8D5JRT3_9PROT|nr:FAD-dependent monooxygenase [Methyloradius palustris]BCM25781.1 2-octaprenyl-6-methoxyphenol hydroxylase [Methyloradius palustris]